LVHPYCRLEGILLRWRIGFPSAEEQHTDRGGEAKEDNGRGDDGGKAM
jgi:hypothetical protein